MNSIIDQLWLILSMLCTYLGDAELGKECDYIKCIYNLNDYFSQLVIAENICIFFENNEYSNNAHESQCHCESMANKFRKLYAKKDLNIYLYSMYAVF